jgi:hypothetical protein
MLVCALCGKLFVAFREYKYHLKIFHSKRTVGDRLICGQDNCPLDYLSVRALQHHIERHHGQCETENAIGTIDNDINSMRVEHAATVSVSDNSACVRTDAERDGAQFVENFRGEIFSQGAISDAAQFISRLRSNPKIPLSVSLEVVESCKDLFKACMSTVKTQALAVLSEHNVNSEKSRRLVDTISLFENPFVGLETLHMQTKYFAQNGFYIAPCPVIVGQLIEPVVSADGTAYRTKSLMAEYVMQSEFFKTFLTIPGVLHGIIAYLTDE